MSMSKMKQHYFNLKQESSKYVKSKGYKSKLDKMNENLYVSNVAYGAPIKVNDCFKILGCLIKKYVLGFEED